MIPEMEKPRVTEIQVRMDCNGCVQKIKKALHGINGICELYIDFPQQKITIIGWADPEKIVKAIKKTRKTAIICSHSEPPDDDHRQQTQPPDDDNSADAVRGDEPPPPASNPPPQPSEASGINPGPTQHDGSSPGQEEGQQQPAEPPKDPPQHLKLEAKPPKSRPKPPAPAAEEPPQASPAVKMTQYHLPNKPKDVEQVHVVYHHPPDYGFRYSYNDNHGSMNQGYNSQWHSYPPAGPGFRPEPPPPPPQQPIYVTHSYNTYRASPYVTGYEYIAPPAATPSPPPQYIHYSRPTPPPPPPEYTHYTRPPPSPPTRYTQYSYNSRPEGYYSDDYHYYGNNGNGNGNITSAFSDENPNACRIV
ncbi:OLC1v1020645C4 [Oldenlandia corymbosa var. corymbosa]|uniref:OLC1v1020645C4 n=2 Tax=Oldenlandia corymbosa var. corymbosa TaxID=529605 RepID=A0AAV1EGX5_OLDCO|nr:OLC1v1020645C4 [Oldenlandia corymbosa var. corymbosa]